MGFSAAAVVVMAIGIGLSYHQNQQAQKQQKKQHAESMDLAKKGQEKQQQVADLQNMRAKRAAVREAQQRKAEVEAAGEYRGGSESTVIAGARSSFGTQAGHQLSFLDTTNKLSGQAATLFGQSQAIGSKPVSMSTLGQGLTTIGGALFQNSGKVESMYNTASNWFNSTSTTTNYGNANAGTGIYDGTAYGG
jgi:hypothetical protein